MSFEFLIHYFVIEAAACRTLIIWRKRLQLSFILPTADSCSQHRIWETWHQHVLINNENFTMKGYRFIAYATLGVAFICNAMSNTSVQSQCTIYGKTISLKKLLSYLQVRCAQLYHLALHSSGKVINCLYELDETNLRKVI